MTLLNHMRLSCLGRNIHHVDLTCCSMDTPSPLRARRGRSNSDLCFGVRKLVAFCSQGQTLQKGSLIMTGTPGGVGLFMKPPEFLKKGM